MNKETIEKWFERAQPSGLHRVAFLKGIEQYRDALKVAVEGMLNTNISKSEILHLLETVEPLPIPPSEKKPLNNEDDDNRYF